MITEHGGDVTSEVVTDTPQIVEYRQSRFSVGFHLLLPVAGLSLVIFGRRQIFERVLTQLNSKYFAVVCPRFIKRENLLKWAVTRLPPTWSSHSAKTLSGGIEELWKDGSLLCTLINTAMPEACPNPHRHWKQSPEHAQALAYKYFGIKPIFPVEEFKRPLTASIDRKFIKYLSELQKAINTVSESSTTDSKVSSKYIVRGMGLSSGEQYKKTIFYIYLDENCEDEDDKDNNITIQIKGPYGTYGETVTPILVNKNKKKKAKRRQERRASIQFIENLQTNINNLFIQKKPVALNEDIDVEAVLEVNRIKVTYVPVNYGIYEINMISNGEIIKGCPFSVHVTADKMDNFKTNLSRITEKQNVRKHIKRQDTITLNYGLIHNNNVDKIHHCNHNSGKYAIKTAVDEKNYIINTAFNNKIEDNVEKVAKITKDDNQNLFTINAIKEENIYTANVSISKEKSLQRQTSIDEDNVPKQPSRHPILDRQGHIDKDNDRRASFHKQSFIDKENSRLQTHTSIDEDVPIETGRQAKLDRQAPVDKDSDKRASFHKQSFIDEKNCRKSSLQRQASINENNVPIETGRQAKLDRQAPVDKDSDRRANFHKQCFIDEENNRKSSLQRQTSIDEKNVPEETIKQTKLEIQVPIDKDDDRRASLQKHSFINQETSRKVILQRQKIIDEDFFPHEEAIFVNKKNINLLKQSSIDGCDFQKPDLFKENTINCTKSIPLNKEYDKTKNLHTQSSEDKEMNINYSIKEDNSTKTDICKYSCEDKLHRHISTEENERNFHTRHEDKYRQEKEVKHKILKEETTSESNTNISQEENIDVVKSVIATFTKMIDESQQNKTKKVFKNEETSKLKTTSNSVIIINKDNIGGKHENEEKDVVKTAIATFTKLVDSSQKNEAKETVWNPTTKFEDDYASNSIIETKKKVKDTFNKFEDKDADSASDQDVETDLVKAGIATFTKMIDTSQQNEAKKNFWSLSTEATESDRSEDDFKQYYGSSSTSSYSDTGKTNVVTQNWSDRGNMSTVVNENPDIVKSTIRSFNERAKIESSGLKYTVLNKTVNRNIQIDYQSNSPVENKQTVYDNDNYLSKQENSVFSSPIFANKKLINCRLHHGNFVCEPKYANQSNINKIKIPRMFVDKNSHKMDDKYFKNVWNASQVKEEQKRRYQNASCPNLDDTSPICPNHIVPEVDVSAMSVAEKRQIFAQRSQDAALIPDSMHSSLENDLHQHPTRYISDNITVSSYPTGRVTPQNESWSLTSTVSLPNLSFDSDRSNSIRDKRDFWESISCRSSSSVTTNSLSPRKIRYLAEEKERSRLIWRKPVPEDRNCNSRREMSKSADDILVLRSSGPEDSVDGLSNSVEDSLDTCSVVSIQERKKMLFKHVNITEASAKVLSTKKYKFTSSKISDVIPTPPVDNINNENRTKIQAQFNRAIKYFKNLEVHSQESGKALIRKKQYIEPKNVTLPKLSEKFKVNNLYEDVFGDKKGSFKGAPNKSALVEALATLPRNQQNIEDSMDVDSIKYDFFQNYGKKRRRKSLTSVFDINY